MSSVSFGPIVSRAARSSWDGTGEPLDDFVRQGGRLESRPAWFGLKQPHELSPDEARRLLREGSAITVQVAAHLATLPILTDRDLEELLSLTRTTDLGKLEHPKLAQTLTSLEGRGAHFFATQEGRRVEVGAYGLYNALTDPAHGLSGAQVVDEGIVYPVTSPGDLGLLERFLQSGHPYRKLARAGARFFRHGTELPAHQAVGWNDVACEPARLTSSDSAVVEAFNSLTKTLGVEGAYRYFEPAAALALKPKVEVGDVAELVAQAANPQERRQLMQVGLRYLDAPASALVRAACTLEADLPVELAAAPLSEAARGVLPAVDPRKLLEELDAPTWLTEAARYLDEDARRSLAEAALAAYPWSGDQAPLVKATVEGVSDDAARLEVSRQGLWEMLQETSHPWVELMVERMNSVNWEQNPVYEAIVKAYPWTPEGLAPLVLECAGAMLDADAPSDAADLLNLLRDAADPELRTRVTLGLTLAQELNPLASSVLRAAVEDQPFANPLDQARLATLAAAQLDDSEAEELGKLLARRLMWHPQTQAAALLADSLLTHDLYEARPQVARAYLARPSAQGLRELAALGREAGRGAEYVEDEALIAEATLRHLLPHVTSEHRQALEKALERLAGAEEEGQEKAVRKAWAALEVVTQLQAPTEAAGSIQQSEDWVQVGDHTVPVGAA